ncbi:MAG: nuclear transport factor 2 family protein [Gammaproteobacteria bacterium]
MPRPIPTALLALTLCLTTPLPASAADDPPHPAAQAVLDFNNAVTERDMDAAMALLADGGVQFHLHPAHPGMPEDPPLTEDMATMWTMVSAILFPTTDSYERRIEIGDVHADGELAVVWTKTRTVTERKGVAEPMVLDFSEMYFLVNKNGGGWRIAGTATNRPVDEIPVT